MGTLYAIGVGPGAPDLLTLRAVKALEKVQVILTAASSNNDYSLALSIAAPYLKPDVRIERLDFPMTRDKTVLEAAWIRAAETAAAILREGHDVAFLTLGDPLIYSTFAYLWRALSEIAPQTRVEIVSGITSFQAAAARVNMSLCEGAEPLTVIPGIIPEDELTKLLDTPGGAAILKVYRNYAAIGRALATTGRDKDCTMASAVEQEGESLRKGSPQTKPPYMTLILCEPRDRATGQMDEK